MKRGERRASIGATFLALALCGALAFAALASGGAESRPPATCFWEGPISTKRPTTRGFDGRNFNFPEESATYWMARFHLPEGARLILRGRYPHGRYMSLNAYSEEGIPTDALSDIAIRPLPGSVNPFVVGNRRDLPRRGWRVTVLDREPPEGARPPNTIYARAQNSAIELFYRVYEPDRGLDLTGEAGLPSQRVRLGDGRVLRGGRACRTVNDADRSIPLNTTPESQWQLRNQPGCHDENPAYDPPYWERFFNYEFAALGVVVDCHGGRETRHAMPHEVEGGNYSNKDSAYVYTHLSSDFGPVLVLRGRLPRTPSTRDGQRIMQGGQMRFWSLCSGESRVTVRTPDCLADRQVPVGRKRLYTIVVSKRRDRPANALRRCGVAWLDWGGRGDGVGDRSYALLIMRNMLVSPGFRHAIQRVQEAGNEREAMAAYLPESRYTTRAAFERRGCP